MRSNLFDLTQDDWDFITEISERFPDRKPSILSRFQFFHHMPAEYRQFNALIAFKSEPRRGMMDRGKSQEEVQSVYSHTRKMPRLLGQIFSKSASLKKKYTPNAARARKILVHDIGEVLTSDFTPEDMARISPEEKVRLEDLAMVIIFENSPARYQAYLDYKEKKTLDDKVIKIGDVMEWLTDVLGQNPPQHIIDEVIASGEATMKKYPELYKDIGQNFIHCLRLSYGFGPRAIPAAVKTYG